MSGRSIAILLAGGLCLVVACGHRSVAGSAGEKPEKEVVLPPPTTKGPISLEEALRRRRSVRQFESEALTLEQIGQLAWAGQGITEVETGLRTAPSAGALYPMKLYLVKRDGVFRYRPNGHRLVEVSGEDRRARLSGAALGQPSVADAALDIVIVGSPEKLRAKYKERAERYVYIEAGHIGENLLLQAAALGLGAVPVGAFDDKAVAGVLGLPTEETPILIVPVGHPARQAR